MATIYLIVAVEAELDAFYLGAGHLPAWYGRHAANATVYTLLPSHPSQEWSASIDILLEDGVSGGGRSCSAIFDIVLHGP